MLSPERRMTAVVLALTLGVLLSSDAKAERNDGIISNGRYVKKANRNASSRYAQFRTAELEEDMGDVVTVSDLQDDAPFVEAEELQEYEPTDVVDMSGDCGPMCYPPFWAHRNGVFADALYLRPTNVDVIYSVEQTGPDPVNDSPTGPTGRLGTDFEPGIRGGFNFAISDCSSVFMSYTWLESEKNSSINANAGTVLASQLVHPSTANAAATSLQSAARHEIDFQLADIGFRHVFYGSESSALNYSLGVRYANLDQDLWHQQIVGVATGLTTVTTDISFEGVGITFGLDGERRSECSGLLIYSKGGVALMAGEFQAQFRQSNQLGGAAVIGNDLVDYRLISMLDAEIGVGWQNACGNLRFTTGFQFQAWTNTLTTREYIRGVQETTFDKLGETLVFNGLTSRLEWRY